MNRHCVLSGIGMVTIVIACAGMAVAVERPVAVRIRARTFPSVFQAWNGVGNGAYDEAAAAVSRHDLVFHGPEFFWLAWEGDFPGQATGFTPASLALATVRRKQLLDDNPRMVMLAEVRYRDAPSTWLPEDHVWWKREGGRRVVGWEEGRFYKLDFTNPDYRRHVARQAKALIETGAVDGIMLDWWIDDDDHVALVTEIRTAIGDGALILVNANDRRIPRSATLVNGLFMECTKSKTPADWARIADTLGWAEGAVRPPRINCLETWWHTSRDDLAFMRMTTTLSLVLSDGYCLFSDPNPLPSPDHLHDWYSFWDIDLGRPLAAVVHAPDGTLRRRFDHGLVVYNPPPNRPATVTFPIVHRSAATGTGSRTFRLDGGDGDCYYPEHCVLDCCWRNP